MLICNRCRQLLDMIITGITIGDLVAVTDYASTFQFGLGAVLSYDFSK